MLVSLAVVAVVAAASLYRFGRPYVMAQRAKSAADWPEAEATIHGGTMELIERVSHFRERVPIFQFSYVVDREYYSGRFGLRVDEERGNTLVRELIGTKVKVRYDPERPATFFVPEELPVHGFRISTVAETELSSQH